MDEAVNETDTERSVAGRIYSNYDFRGCPVEVWTSSSQEIK